MDGVESPDAAPASSSSSSPESSEELRSALTMTQGLSIFLDVSAAGPSPPFLSLGFREVRPFSLVNWMVVGGRGLGDHSFLSSFKLLQTCNRLGFCSSLCAEAFNLLNGSPAPKSMCGKSSLIIRRLSYQTMLIQRLRLFESSKLDFPLAER